MKTAFVVLVGLVTAAIGVLWLIGYGAHQIGLYPGAPWQSLGGTILTGLSCAFLGGVVVCFAAFAAICLMFALVVIHDYLL